MSDDAASCNDDDLVYVDPALKEIIGKVAFDERGNPKVCSYPAKEGEHTSRDCCPYGTYRSMKRTFRIGGKVTEEKGQASLDDVLPKLLNDTL